MSKKNRNNVPVLTGEESTTVATETASADATVNNESAVKSDSTGYVIEEVSLPKRSGRKGSLDYPIAQLEAGTSQSFKVPATSDTIKAVTASIRAFAYRHDHTVVIRAESDGVRVWRKK